MRVEVSHESLASSHGARINIDCSIHVDQTSSIGGLSEAFGHRLLVCHTRTAIVCLSQALCPPSIGFAHVLCRPVGLLMAAP